MHTCTRACHRSALTLEYDVEALIMDVSSSWKGGKALIYTHRFPGIFIGLAKCHYTAGGEVMNCNKLWCGWVCVSCHWLINRNTVTSLKRSTTLPPPVIFSNAYRHTQPRLWTEIWICVQVQTHTDAFTHVYTHTRTVCTCVNKKKCRDKIQLPDWLLYIGCTVFPQWRSVWTACMRCSK